jgi:bile acid-coenzyme A ligase
MTMAVVPMGAIPAFNAARLGADSAALIHGQEVVTWGELDHRSTQRAWALKAAGVAKDDLVTVALKNSATFYELTFALWKLGATPHIVSWRLPRLEVASILRVAQPRVLVASDPELIAAFGGFDPATSLSEPRDDPLPGEVATYWKAVSSGGSTGVPKIIIEHMPGAIDPELPVRRIPRDERILNPGPLYHNAPFVGTHRALFRGNTVVCMLKFDPEEALRLIAEHRITWVNMVPTMMLRIWRLPKEVRDRYDLSSLQSVWHMAAPMPPWLKEAWIEWLGAERIFEYYGGAERQGATEISGTEWLEHRGSVGRPILCEMRILNEVGKEVPMGEVGEIFMRPTAERFCEMRILNEVGKEVPTGEMGETFMAPTAERGTTTYHYLGATVRSADGGFESIGDFGWMDADGYVYLADRRTDMILVGGANVYPAEVEAALMQHPGVEVAVVIGLPDEDLGATVHAIVKPHDDYAATLDAAMLSRFIEERLARYKTPRSYEFTTQQLRDDSGKVRRTALREERLQRQSSQPDPPGGSRDEP